MNTNDETLTHSAVASSRQIRRRIALGALAGAVLVSGAAYAGYQVFVGSRFEATEDAYTAADTAVITSQIDGLVSSVPVVDSQAVRKGDVLVALDPTDARLALRQAEADLARAKAQQAAAAADLERASIDLSRRAPLAGSGSISGDELTRVRNGVSLARAAFEAARAGVSLAQSRVERARLDLQRTVIRAPIDGVVARREVQLGQHIQPSLPLLSVVPVKDIYVNANFKEIQLKAVKVGQRVTLESDLYGHKVEFHGTVAGFNGGTGAAFALIPAQNATGNWIKVVQRLPVRIQLDAAELQAHPLRVGLSMTARIELASNS